MARKPPPGHKVKDPDNPNFKEILAEHARLAPDDDRVRHDFMGVFKGRHFVPEDKLHQFALAGLTEVERQHLAKVQQAIAHNEPVYFSYHSKKKKSDEPVTRAGRAEEYKGEERMEAPVGHGILPVHVGVHFDSKTGKPTHGQIHGLSGSVVANNLHLLNSVLGDKSPYQDPKHPKFAADLLGYLRNLNNGWTGDGGEAINDPKHPVTAGYTPHKLFLHEADFLNAIIHNNTARYNSTNSKRAREINRAHKGSFLDDNGEVNPVRAAVDHIQQNRGVVPPGHSWVHHTLEPAIHTFNTNQIGDMHWEPAKMPEALRPAEGTEAAHKAFLKEGTPPKELTGGHPRGPKPRVRVKAVGKKEAPGPGEEIPEEEPKKPAGVAGVDRPPTEEELKGLFPEHIMRDLVAKTRTKVSPGSGDINPEFFPPRDTTKDPYPWQKPSPGSGDINPELFPPRTTPYPWQVNPPGPADKVPPAKPKKRKSVADKSMPLPVPHAAISAVYR